MDSVVIAVSEADLDRVAAALFGTGNFDAPLPVIRVAVEDWVGEIVDEALDDPRWAMRRFGRTFEACLGRAERKAGQAPGSV